MLFSEHVFGTLIKGIFLNVNHRPTQNKLNGLLFLVFRKMDAIHAFAREGEVNNLIKCIDGGVSVNLKGLFLHCLLFSPVTCFDTEISEWYYIGAMPKAVTLIAWVLLVYANWAVAEYSLRACLSNVMSHY